MNSTRSLTLVAAVLATFLIGVSSPRPASAASAAVHHRQAMRHAAHARHYRRAQAHHQHRAMLHHSRGEHAIARSHAHLARVHATRAHRHAVQARRHHRAAQSARH